MSTLYTCSSTVVAAATCSSTATWGYWTQAYTTANTTCTSNTWTIWTATGTSNAVNATATWVDWNNSYLQQQAQYCFGQQMPPCFVPQLTAEEVAARRETERAAQVEREKWESVRIAVKAKARETLISFLTDEERAQFEKDGVFNLTVEDRIYRIRPGAAVEQLDPVTRSVRSRFCIHHRHGENLPDCDTALHQKLLLQADETEFRRLANETRIAA